MSDDERDNDIESDADKRAHHNALERKRRDHIKDSFTSLRDSLPAFQGDKIKHEPKKQDKDKPFKDNDEQHKPKCGKKHKPGKNMKCSICEPAASRAQILKKAADYIQSMRRENSAHQQDIDDLKRQNKILEEQIRSLEKAKATGNFAAAAAVLEATHIANSKAGAVSGFEGDSESEESSNSSEASKNSRRKRLKPNSEVPMRT